MQPPLSAMSLCDMNKVSKPADEGPSDKSSIADLKNGKVVFKQKPISFEKHSETLQEIVKFREMLEERNASRAAALTTIPEEHKPVVVKLAHESDKTLSGLSKHILQELLPLESALKSVANRNNYGLDGIAGVKAPAAVCVWRWEAKPAHLDWLPKSAREKAENRMAERAQAKLDLKAMFDSLAKDEQDSILDPKGASGKTSAKDGTSGSGFTIDLTGDDMKSSPLPSKKKKENEGKRLVGRPKKIVDSEKTAKEKEKQEKKAAKAEREQKEKDAQNKSRSLMQNFFKTGNTPRAVPAKETEAEAAPSSNVSQFQKTFKPFVVKKDTTVAPVNWFTTSQNTSRRLPLTYEGDLIVVDDADDMESMDLARLSVKDRLRYTLQTLPPPLHPHVPPTRILHGGRSIAQLKTSNTISVRSMLAKLNEAEVGGDISQVRSILTSLADRDVVPAKVLIFADDARPGYFGTWTRDSEIIGPRTPFAKDVAIFDYGYDSGEEWEEEPAGDADDVVDDGEDDEGEPDDADSDLDSWLVDDEDEAETPDKERSASPVFSTLHAPTKRKAETEDSKLTKKRKVVVPLTPFAKGPVWEQTIGRCDNIFNAYRIQLFNDTPLPIDPFTFVSQYGETRRTSKKDGFAVPTLPDRLIASTPVYQPDASSLPSVPPVAKRAVVAPKTVFPEVHLSHLLAKIATTQTASLPILIDTIYQDLRDHKVKKNSIEAKVREVAEKCKIKRVWVVKEDVKVAVSGA
ncbi:chromatin assembly factor 1 subunit A-domain-containing protein [Mycena vulgaris]|nr:chromatin assembly factor 1 subunit A-domain-containing protein [Mycena vulgaris]